MSLDLDEPHAPTDGNHRRRWRPRLNRRTGVALASIVVLVASAVAGYRYWPFGGNDTAGSTTSSVASRTSTATVTRQTLTSQTTVDATLGYADSYTVTNQVTGGSSAAGSAGGQSAPLGGSNQPAAGVLTAVPKIGDVIRQGQTLYQVNGKPVVLLYGSTPAYRDLAEGRNGPDVTGPDVRQLNADLVALGYAKASDLDPAPDEFSWATRAAVKKLQAHLGVDQTGSLDLGQVAFLPAAVRITSVTGTLGAPVNLGAPVLAATSTTRQVTADLDASQQSAVKVGDKVTVTLPGNRTTAALVSAIGTKATPPASSSGTAGSATSSGSGGGSSSGSGDVATVEVDITLSDAAVAHEWDEAPVQVTIITDRVNDALVVPVVALLAQAGGGYAVEVAPDTGDAPGAAARVVPVTLGMFDDAEGLVQVTGTGLSAGQRVVVPSL